MANQFLEPYRILEELFEAEQSAFKEMNTQKLAGLVPQIQRYCRKVADLEKHFSELSTDQIRAAKVFIRRLQEHVGRSRNSWESYQNKLEQERSLVQASKRLIHQTKLGQSNRSRRISHSA